MSEKNEGPMIYTDDVKRMICEGQDVGARLKAEGRIFDALIVAALTTLAATALGAAVATAEFNEPTEMKPRRGRRTKAEIEAANAEMAAKQKAELKAAGGVSAGMDPLPSERIPTADENPADAE